MSCRKAAASYLLVSPPSLTLFSLSVVADVAAASIISVKHSRDTSTDRKSPIRFSPGVPSAPSPSLPSLSSSAIGMLVTSRRPPFPRLQGCNNGIQLVPRVAFRRSFHRSFVQIKWPDGIWSLAVNEAEPRSGRRRRGDTLLARSPSLHPILRVYPIWPVKEDDAHALASNLRGRSFD